MNEEKLLTIANLGDTAEHGVRTYESMKKVAISVAARGVNVIAVSVDVELKAIKVRKLVDLTLVGTGVKANIYCPKEDVKSYAGVASRPAKQQTNPNQTKPIRVQTGPLNDGSDEKIERAH